MRDAAREHGRVERGVARHGQDTAVGRVDRHHGAANAPALADDTFRRNELRETRVGHVLNGRFDGQVHVGAARGGRFAFDLDHAATRVDDHAPLAVLAREHVVVICLDAAFAHGVAQLDGAVARHGVELIFRNRARVTERVRCKRPVRVLAYGALVHRHALERVGMLRDERGVALARIRRHDTLALRARALVLDARAHDIIRNAQDGRQALHDVVVVGDRSVRQHCERRSVLHEQEPVCIIDLPTRGRGGHRGVFVLYGFVAVLLRRENLHAPQLGRERPEHGGGKHAHGHETRAHGFARPARRGARRRVRHVLPRRRLPTARGNTGACTETDVAHRAHRVVARPHADHGIVAARAQDEEHHERGKRQEHDGDGNDDGYDHERLPPNAAA